ncbi:hypothetical protein LCGC14_0985150 [marine sediment metagenome]|uniref:Uncharacterized protein n=1 Tax=marine sediment metagenome TaxID=412755 RepID=A0A0F9NBZ7_9ZZZZ
MADLATVLAKEKNLGELHARMDEDKDLAYLKPYVLRDKTKHKVAGIINVTLNIPAMFNAHVQASLMGATQQAHVTGDGLQDEQTRPVEKFLDVALKSVDRRLKVMGEPALRPVIAEQADLRGRIAARVLFRKDAQGNLVTDILPFDARHFTHEMGVDGMEWGAYKTWRAPDKIRSQYPDLSSTAVPDGEDLEVTDLWQWKRGGAEPIVVNSVYVGANIARDMMEYPKLRRLPIVYHEVPLGSMLKDKDASPRRGESIFYLIRDLIPEYNRLASLMQTSNQAAILRALTWHTKEGIGAKIPEDGGKMGTSTAAEVGGGYQLVPIGDIQQAGRLMQALLSRLIQAGSLSLTDLGNLSFPLSAVALIELGEASGKVFLPRLGTMGLFYEDAGGMAIEQVLDLGMSTIELGTRGHKQTFQVADLKGDYDIEYQFFVKAPQTDAALFALADVAKEFLDPDTVLRDVIKVPNPTEIQEKRRHAEAELISPGVKLRRTAEALWKQGEKTGSMGDKVDALIMAEEMGLSIEKVLGEEPGEKPPKPGGNGQQPARNKLGVELFPGTRAASNTRSARQAGAEGSGEGK